MKYRYSLYLFSFMFILCACEKPEQPSVIPSDTPLLVKIQGDGNDIEQFIYNSSNLITEQKSRHFYTRHSYNSDGQLVLSEFYVDEKFFSSSFYPDDNFSDNKWVDPDNTEVSNIRKYKYDEKGLLTQVTDRSHTMIIEYNSANRIIKLSFYREGELNGYHEYEYDFRGNLKLRRDYTGNEANGYKLAAQSTFTYDNRNNPYHAFKQLALPGRYTNINNITKEVYTIFGDTDSNSQDEMVTEYTYEYNDEGYPVKVNDVLEYIYN